MLRMNLLVIDYAFDVCLALLVKGQRPKAEGQV
jgi:hypothetical protein